ncbi:adenosylcobinamide-GDP ribazoletransferase [Metallosphaera tengchongensis]|uniref:Adenosylcobinamide-GDP ribazoletransferase n=1 Tax=Metallosphaera tengchongensis TaxID=1532350 RepID=A0A6N0NXB7_9CREN|nr:adenosylcobinamide-GDP ribazoletransferase [Metallosphaera tengchongensis]QKR00018.1 adenosylcobinamide-GDP ribazoletransferase [Metallosphaera tengchongensis]
MRILKGIIAQLSFFSIVPSGQTDFQLVIDYSYLSPIVVGAVMGALDYIVVFLTHFVLENFSYLLLIPFVEIMRGFNHLDGLLDFGDALMIRGSPKDRLRALKDVSVGAGGFGLAIVYLTIFYISTRLLTGYSLTLLYYLVSAEVVSRAIGLSVLSTLKPMDGSQLGKMFHEKLRNKLPVILLQVVPFISLSVAVLFIVLALIFSSLGKKILGGSSGDLIGATISLSFPLLLIGDVKCYPFCLPHFF